MQQKAGKLLLSKLVGGLNSLRKTPPPSSKQMPEISGLMVLSEILEHDAKSVIKAAFAVMECQ